MRTGLAAQCLTGAWPGEQERYGSAEVSNAQALVAAVSAAGPGRGAGGPACSRGRAAVPVRLGPGGGRVAALRQDRPAGGTLSARVPAHDLERQAARGLSAQGRR